MVTIITAFSPNLFYTKIPWLFLSKQIQACDFVSFLVTENPKFQMYRSLLRSKIHRARVTDANLEYEGSVSIDQDLMDAAELVEFEQVDIYNVTNGNRLTTYAIPGKRGSGEICINGAAARLVDPNDIIIICCYGWYNEVEVASHQALVVSVDQNNHIKVLQASK
jgi:aspartate 1-decarboxylase